MTLIKGIPSLCLCWFVVVEQRPPTMWFSELSIIFFFNFKFLIFLISLKILPSVSNYIQLWNGMVFHYMGSQSTITFGIKATLFTLCLCMKLILVPYRYIWCLILYTSYGRFFDGHVRWFNRWPVTMLIICELQGTSLERGFKWRRLVPRLK